MSPVDRERRAICRECGRGAAAPHEIDCVSGRESEAYRTFHMGDALRRYNDDVDNTREKP